MLDQYRPKLEKKLRWSCLTKAHRVACVREMGCRGGSGFPNPHVVAGSSAKGDKDHERWMPGRRIQGAHETKTNGTWAGSIHASLRRIHLLHPLVPLGHLRWQSQGTSG